MTTPEKYFTSHQVRMISGLTYRRFDYLMSHLQGKHVGTGRRRHFTWPDLLNVAKYAALLDFGIEPVRAWELAQLDAIPADETAPVRLCADWGLLTTQVVEKLELYDSVG